MPTGNSLRWTKKATKQWLALPLKERRRVADGVETLRRWPCCVNVSALSGRDEYRLRVGRYRVIFTVDTANLPIIVSIEEVRKRNEQTY
jgi:mRNA-degrading endonuclease RelE of RelBE toxin-antitoxin system